VGKFTIPRGKRRGQATEKQSVLLPLVPQAAPGVWQPPPHVSEIQLGRGTAQFQRPTLALRERETEGGGQNQAGCGS
jgi:hypothetical protein